MIEQVELTMSGRNRITLKRLPRGYFLELSRPTTLADGHGWVIQDCLFCTDRDIAKLRALLMPDGGRDRGQ